MTELIQELSPIQKEYRSKSAVTLVQYVDIVSTCSIYMYTVLSIRK